MSLKNTLFMALMLGLVALFIFRYDIPEGERIERESFVLRKATDDQVKRIAVTNEKGTYVFVRGVVSQGENREAVSGWQLEGLPEALLDASAVSTLSSGLQAFKSDSVIPPAEVSPDLSVYGLHAPVMTIEVGEGEGRTTIAFGKKNDFIDKRYARITGANGRSDIVMTAEAVFTAASKSRDEFRERNPLQFPDSSIATIVGEWKGTRIVLEQGASDWKIKEPVETAADNEAVLSMVRELRGLKVAEYFDQVKDLAAYGLIQPEAILQVTFKDAARKPISIAASAAPVGADSAQGGVFFSLGGSTVYRAATNPLAKIVQPVNAFRIRRLFPFEVDDTRKLVVSRAGEPAITFEAQGPNWKVNGEQGDVVFVLQYLNDISFLDAIDFPKPDQKDLGFDKPSMQFELTLKSKDDKESTRALLIGKRAPMPTGGEGYYAADRDQLNLPFMLSVAAVQKLTPKVEALKKPASVPAPL